MDDLLHCDLFIGGEWRPAADGRRMEVVDPATEEPVTRIAQASREDTMAAIEAAAAALPAWRRVPPWDRSAVLRKAATLLADRAEKVARRLTLEVGKPIAQARAEIQATVECIDWYADEARRLYGESLAGRAPGQRFFVVHEPVGVVAAFTAWNFPVVLQARKIAPALAAGCTVVARPAEEGTGAVTEMIRCFVEAGVPPGVLNLLTGLPQEIAETVMDSDLVRKVSFTGSIPIGQHLIRRSADTVKRLSMELGGHAPVIVHEDVDVAEVAAVSAVGKCRNAGQVCVSPTRFFVHRRIKDAFVEHFVAATRRLRLGHGLDPETDVGPLINRRRLEFVEKMVADTVADGGKLLLGGRRPADLNRGFFFEPTVLDEVPDEARAMREEPFGPIALVTGFEDFDEVVARANALPYGLAAYTFTRSMNTAQRTIDALEVGIVGVNTYVAATTEMPFGGVKHSGFGRENGRQGIQDYLNVKFANVVM